MTWEEKLYIDGDVRTRTIFPIVPVSVYSFSTSTTHFYWLERIEVTERAFTSKDGSLDWNIINVRRLNGRGTT